MKSSSNTIQVTQASLKGSRPQIQDHQQVHKTVFENNTKSKQKNVLTEPSRLLANPDLIDLRVKADEDRPE